MADDGQRVGLSADGMGSSVSRPQAQPPRAFRIVRCFRDGRQGLRQAATGLQAALAVAPVVTPMLQDTRDDMRVRDVRRRPPAMTRSLPPQCGNRLRAPQQVNREYTLQWHVTRLSIQDNGAVGTASRSSWLASCTCPSGGVCPRPRCRRGCRPDFGITSARRFAFGAHRRAISRGSGPGSREDVAPTPPARRRTSP